MVRLQRVTFLALHNYLGLTTELFNPVLLLFLCPPCTDMDCAKMFLDVITCVSVIGYWTSHLFFLVLFYCHAALLKSHCISVEALLRV